MTRCDWVPPNDPLYTAYHDLEWGVPVYDDRRLFEFLVLDGAQAGLSWATILRKRDNYRLAFDGFEPEKVALYDEAKIAELLANPGIVRNRLKIRAAITNAQAYLNLVNEYGSFSEPLWQFAGGKPKKNAWRTWKEIPAKTEESALDEQVPHQARLHVRRFNDLLCLHAGRRNGERPYRRLLSV